jgi:hypothetical protein
MAKKYVEKLPQCANCEQALNGENFCPNCGQVNQRPDLNFGHFIAESLSNFFAFDSKFFSTLYTLFRYPGRLPKLFIDGKRMSFMNPMRLYLLSTIILLFVIALDLTNRKRSIVEFKENSALSMEAGQDQQAVYIERWEALDTTDDRLTRMFAYSRAYPLNTTEEALVDLGLKNTWKRRFMYELVSKFVHLDPERFEEFYMSKLIWILFFFVPFLALWLKVLYIRQRIHYLKHLFFSFYTQSAFFILIIIGLLLFPLIGSWGLQLFIVLFSTYLYVSLRRFYGQPRGKTLLKLFLLISGYSVILGIVTFASLVISYIFY